MFDCSATATISTTLGGKCPLAPSGAASDSPAVMFSAASLIAADSTRLPVESLLIFSDRTIGTPPASSVPSTRQNRDTARLR